MYICSKCGEVFDEPLREEERPCSDFPETESWYYCPHCHSDEYEEAEQCKVCGEWRKETECEEGVCNECVNNTMKRFYSLMLDKFSEKERNIIKDNIEVDLI